MSMFQLKDILLLITCILNSKKIIVVSEKAMWAQKVVYYIKDTILKRLGFNWQHFYSTYYTLSEASQQQVQDTRMSNNKALRINLLLSDIPVLVSASTQILADEIIASLFSRQMEKQLQTDSKSSKMTVHEIFIVDIDQGSIMPISSYKDQLNRKQTVKYQPKLPSFFLDMLSPPKLHLSKTISQVVTQVKQKIDNHIISKARPQHQLSTDYQKDVKAII